jgi:hypothetical protein
VSGDLPPAYEARPALGLIEATGDQRWTAVYRLAGSDGGDQFSDELLCVIPPGHLPYVQAAISRRRNGLGPADRKAAENAAARHREKS